MITGFTEVRILMECNGIPLEEILADLRTKPGVLAATAEEGDVVRMDVENCKLAEFTNWFENLVPTKKN